MHDDEVDAGIDVARRLVAAQFPQWADLPLEPVESFGTDNAIYRLGGELSVRLPLHEPSVHVDREAEVLGRLAGRLPLELPRQVAVGEPGAGYPLRWSVQTWLPGGNAAAGLRDLREAAGDLARFVRALQAVETEGAPESPRGRPLAARDAQFRRSLAQAEGLLDTAAALAAWEAALGAPDWGGPPVWSHGDLLAGNLLAVEGRLSGVIDWPGAGVGDPMVDLLPAWSLFDPEAREVYRSELGVDDATWARGRGLALSQGVIAMPYYVDTNPGLFEIGRRAVEAVLSATDLSGI
jgi:aminoglycoside phosphotransferase (APT) family kinase protein